MEAAQAPPAQPTLTEEAAIAALVVILASDLPESRMGDFVAALLKPFGFGEQAVRRALALLYPHLQLVFGLEAQSASSWLARTLPARQAAYLIAASRRLAVNPSDDDERRYLRQHLDAERRRREAVGRVDAAARQWGPVLGWHSRHDDLVTPACRAADGMNFRAERPPAIGWPGTLHAGACRCRAGAPFRGATMMDELPPRR